MRLALVIALAPDRRSGRVLSGILPADKAVEQVKEAIVANAMHEGFPNLEAVALDSCLRRHRFKPDAVLIAEDASASAPAAELITVELGEGEGKVLLNVTTAEEAAFVRQLAESAAGAEKRIQELMERLVTLESELKQAQSRTTTVGAASQEGQLLPSEATSPASKSRKPGTT